MKINFINLFLGCCLIFADARLIRNANGFYSVNVEDAMGEGARQASEMYQRHLKKSKSENMTLQSMWWNWNFCTSAYYKEEFTAMNSLVPKDVVFLAGFQSFGPKVDGIVTCADPHTRTGTISAGKQTVFFPILNSVSGYDLNDDFVLGKPDCFANVAEATFARFYYAFVHHMDMIQPELYKLLYAKLDGESLTPFYLIEDDVLKLKQCPDKRTNKEYDTLQGNPHGEICDAEPFAHWEGVDYGPMHGWWGIVTREWVGGDVHTFEFGGAPASQDCISAKYILTVE